MSMALSMRIYFVFLFCFIPVCYGNEPTDFNNVNMKLLELENEILRLKEAACVRDQDIGELSRLTKIPNVAFRSTLTKTFDHVTDGTIIVFDRVGLNIGNAYNPHNGVFTAPYNGTYLFSMALGNAGGKPGVFFLIQSDGNKRESIEFVFGGHTPGWDMGGYVTVAQLNEGNSVWIEGEGHVSGSSPIARYHTGFSGALFNIIDKIPKQTELNP